MKITKSSMEVASQHTEQNLRSKDIHPSVGMANAQETWNFNAGQGDFQKTVDDIVLSKYAAAGVVVNGTMNIVQSHGRTASYLTLSPDKPMSNILKIAKEGLSFELRKLLQKAKKEKAAAAKENVLLNADGSLRNISIEVIPFSEIAEPYYLVLFHDSSVESQHQGISNWKSTNELKPDDNNLRIAQLERELVEIREEMRRIIEEHETANEELQAANEELLSNSEELQILNEELETGKEELQSTNEELIAANLEMTALNEKVTEERDFSQAIVTTIREPLPVLDEDLRIQSANSNFYKTFTATQIETEGKLIYELGDGQWNIPALRKLLEDILPQKSQFTDYEVRHNFKKLGSRLMLLNAREIISAKTKEKLILLAIEDITDSRRTQESEEQLQNIFSQAPVAIIMLKGWDYVVELANDFYLRIVEKGKDFIGKPFFESLPILKTQGVKELFDNVMQTGTPFYAKEMNFDILRNNKREQCFFDFIYHPVREKYDIVTGIIVVVTEVTEQVLARKKIEESNEKFHSLITAAPIGIGLFIGRDLIIENPNQKFIEIIGKGPDIVGKPLSEVMPELVSEGQPFLQILDDVFTSGKMYQSFGDPVNIIRNGVLHKGFYDINYVPLSDGEGKVYGIMDIATDVTDQVIAKNRSLENEQFRAKELEESVRQRTAKLSEANEELQKKNKELESFAYVSSHDLQEPLRKIQTFAGRIVDKEYATLSDTSRDYLHRMQTAARRMQTLIQDLLAYSHTSNNERRFEKTDLTKIVEEVKADLEETILEKKATIEVVGECNANLNASQFSQLMHNLIGNSLKFAFSHRPPHITIKSEIVEGNEANQLSTGKKYCHISVADNGIGFDHKYREKIFQVFQRLHGKDEYMGTGIGLAIVKRIVDNHNGIIRATGELNKGASFDIYIPVS